MLLHNFLERFEEETAQRKISDLIQSDDWGESKAEFFGHFLRSVYQPIYTRDRNHLVAAGFEAFLRPAAGDQSVPVEEYFAGFSPEDSAFVDRLCSDLHIRNFLKGTRPPEFLSLNVEPRALAHQLNRFEEFKNGFELAKENGLSPDRVWIKLDLSPDLDAGIIYSFVNQARDLGVNIALSCFDCDHASFTRIIHNQPDSVIFNRSWVHQGVRNPANIRITVEVVKTLISLGITPHIECLESSEELKFAIRCGFERFQGFFLKHPASQISRKAIELNRILAEMG